MFRALKLNSEKEDPNHIFVMCTPNGKKSTTSLSRGKRQRAKLPVLAWRLDDGNGSSRSRLVCTIVATLAAMLIFVHTLSPRDSSSDGVTSRLRFSSNKQAEPKTNRFSYSKNRSPYEEIWINSKLPGWAKKKKQFRDIEESIPASERICYVHVGKAGGSSVGCGLGFSLHCNNSTQKPLGGLLPRRATRMFHTDVYDCHDDSAYFLFVVRNPVERLKSAFLYERPTSEKSLKKKFPEYYENRKNLYLDCPSFGIFENFVQDGLTKHGHASEVCKIRAFTAVRGERHFSCHMYFNYQFHLEGVPEDADLLAIRSEHLVQDWNAAEHLVGGPREIIDPERANETIHVMNKSTKNQDDKRLSDGSVRILCRQLCNEIVSYKKILRRAVNLSYKEVERSVEELRETCGEYADYEDGTCPTGPMPDLREKLINTRGYEDIVMEGSYINHKERLETQMHVEKKDDELEAKAAMDDDDYDLPYSE